MTPRRTAFAFTLIELLVVVAIIVALLAILMPSLSKAITQAHRTVCLSQIHQQHLAQINYAASHMGAFPVNSGHSPDYHRWGGNPSSAVTTMHGTYMPDRNILICPLVADAPQQPYGEYRRNDWLGGAYGGWDTAAPNVYTAYMWFAGFRTTGITLLNGTRPFPQRAADLGSGVPFITHRLDFYTASNSHEITHGGRGLANAGVAPLHDFQTTDMPYASGDGAAIIRMRPDMMPRYADTTGGTGTYIW